MQLPPVHGLHPDQTEIMVQVDDEAPDEWQKDCPADLLEPLKASLQRAREMGGSVQQQPLS
jgi:hypothetical protein